jgi:hypothetical protein
MCTRAPSASDPEWPRSASNTRPSCRARIVHVERWPNGILRHTFTFVVVPEGTRLVQVGELVPSGVRGMLSPVLKGRFKRRFAQIAEGLKRYLYAGGGQGD